MIYSLDTPLYVATVDWSFFSFVNFFKIMARTVEKKWSTEALSKYPSRIETGLWIRTHIIWEDNLPRGRLGYVRLNITTEGCEEPHMSSKAWCVRVIIIRFAEDSRYCLDRIKIRIHISLDSNILVGNLGKREIIDRHCLRLFLNFWNSEASFDSAHVPCLGGIDSYHITCWPHIAFGAWNFEAWRKYNCTSFDPAHISFLWRLEWLLWKDQYQEWKYQTMVLEVEFEA